MKRTQFTTWLFSIHALVLVGGTIYYNLYSKPSLAGKYLSFFAAEQQWKVFREVNSCRTPNLYLMDESGIRKYAPFPMGIPSTNQPTREMALFRNSLTNKHDDFLSSYISRWCKKHNFSQGTRFRLTLECGEHNAPMHREVTCSS